MIFALSTDDRTLHVFPNEAEAIACCEGADIEDGVWRFFDEDGEGLEAVFLERNRRGSFCVASGTYMFRTPEVALRPLLDQLDEVAAVEGPPPFNTVAAIERLLTSRSRPAP